MEAVSTSYHKMTKKSDIIRYSSHANDDFQLFQHCTGWTSTFHNEKLHTNSRNLQVRSFFQEFWTLNK